MKLALLPVLAALLAPALAHAADDSQGKDEVKIHIGTVDAELHERTSAKDLDIAAYPGAIRIEKDDDGDGALTLALSFASKAFKLSLAKFHSSDAPAVIVAFYQRELAKHGTVTTCDPASSATAACKDHGVEDGSTELRVGPKSDQRIVEVTPQAGGVRLTLVHLRAPLVD